MTPQVSEKDWLLLSRYLAGALSIRQVKALELRLVSDSELTEAVNQLKQVRVILSACPEKKVPHNFTIKSGQQSRRHEIRLFPTFRFATVVASILLAVVVGFGMLSPLAGKTNRMMDMTVVSQESMAEESIAPPAAPKAAPPVNDTITATPDERTAAGAGMLTGPSPSQANPEAEMALTYETDNLPIKRTIPWGGIALTLGIISLSLATLTVYVYYRERV
jgi:hypothetical protein